MAQYLVLYRGVSDDLPVKLFNDRREAKRFAKELADHYEGCHDGPGLDGHHDAVEGVLEVFGIDVGTYVGVSTVTLKGGVPYAITHLEATYE